MPSEARSYLAQYLFRGEDVFKPVSALSGGERARLALAILALEGLNFLLLDEPTNHLDIPAREALQEVLENFSGTILLVSHDRYLIDRLATQIWELRDGQAEHLQGHLPRVRAAPGRGHLGAARPADLAAAQADGARQQQRNPAPHRSAGPARRAHPREGERHPAPVQRAAEGQREARLQPGPPLSEQLAQVQASLDSLMADWERLAVLREPSIPLPPSSQNREEGGAF